MFKEAKNVTKNGIEWVKKYLRNELCLKIEKETLQLTLINFLLTDIYSQIHVKLWYMWLKNASTVV